MAKFKLTKDIRKEESDIGKRVASAGAGIAKQKSSSMWGGIGGGMLGAAIAGTAAVSTALTGGALAPLWLTMAGTGIGAAAGSKLGEEVAEGGGLGKGGLYKALTLQTRGEADYEKERITDTKFFKEEARSASDELASLSKSVSDSHMWTGVKAAALAGASDVLKGTKILGKGDATLKEVLTNPKGTFTGAEKLSAVAQKSAEQQLTPEQFVQGKSGNFTAKELSQGIVKKGVKNTKIADAGLDLAQERTTFLQSEGLSDKALETYQDTSQAAKDRFWKQAVRTKNLEKGRFGTDFQSWYEAEQQALSTAGFDEATMFEQMHQQGMTSGSGAYGLDFFGTGKYNQNVGGVSQSMADGIGLIDNEGLQQLSGGSRFGDVAYTELNERIVSEYDKGFSVSEATENVMGSLGFEKPSFLEAVFDKSKTLGEYAWSN
jgi:hypothetical protein